MDSYGASSSEVDQMFAQVTATLDGLAASTLTDVTRAASTTSGSGTLREALTTLGSSYDEVRAAEAQGAAIEAVWFGPAAGRPEAAVEAAGDTALYNEARQRTARSTVPAIAASSHALDTDPAVSQYATMALGAEKS